MNTLELPDDEGLLGPLVRLNVAVDRELYRICASHGLSTADYLVLGVIRRSVDHRSSPTAICDLLGRTTGGMTLTLDRLETQGWIHRLPDPDDRRRVVVEATPAGLDLATEVNTSLHAWEQTLPLTTGARDAISRAMDRLTTALAAGPL